MIGIIAITNSNGGNTSPRKILSGFSAQLSFLLLLSVFDGFLDGSYDFVGYLIQFKTVYYSSLWDHIICLFVINPCHS